MKQLAQYQNGRMELQEVPVPISPPGGALVRTLHSVISVGTEKMKVEQARMNLLQKAMARPDQVRKVLDTAKTLGWRSALEKVRNRLESPAPLGYSAAGEVIAVDPLNTRLRVGDRVACAGAECAFHAEYLAMPDMLMARVPEGVSTAHAAYTTVASIALQAVRQSKIEPGARVAVVGQGLIGILLTNLLDASGVGVVAVDLLPDRREVCLRAGAEHFCSPAELRALTAEWTHGFGLDAVFLCTATSSNQPVEDAAEVLRDRGLLLIVGNTKTDLDWKRFYEKEIEVRYSRSYGPGRYDPSYEWGGADYPFGYVRWTEQRNMQACLDFMARGRLRLDAITTETVPFAECIAVYNRLLENPAASLGVVLEYEEKAEGGKRKAESRGQKAVSGGQRTEVSSRDSTRLATPAARLHIIGAGNFARTMLLPHVKGKIQLGTVVNNTALSARHVKEKFGFTEAATDAAELLGKIHGEAVIIATRHNLHAPQVLRALAGDNHVFVEKPLCLTRAELAEIDAAMESSIGVPPMVQSQHRQDAGATPSPAGSRCYEDHRQDAGATPSPAGSRCYKDHRQDAGATVPSGSVQVGFNRRFAPVTVALKEALDTTRAPKIMTCIVHAGRLDPAHWYANYEESGGRILGEACHFFDLLGFLAGAPATRVFSSTTKAPEGRLDFPDTICSQIEFADGSSGQIIYTGEGDPSFPKEILTVSSGAITGKITNFLELELHKNRKTQRIKSTSKGHAEQITAWLDFLTAKTPHPLPYEQSRSAMNLTFAAIDSLHQREVVVVSH